MKQTKPGQLRSFAAYPGVIQSLELPRRARTLDRLVKGLLTVAIITLLTAVIDSLSAVGLGGAAEWLCRAALRADRSSFSNHLAYVLAARGDVEGGLRVLEESLPGEEWRFFRCLHSGLICDRAGQFLRAAEFIDQAMAVPAPAPVSEEWRSEMTAYVSRLRQQASGDTLAGAV